MRNNVIKKERSNYIRLIQQRLNNIGIKFIVICSIYKFHSVDILIVVMIDVDAQRCCQYQLKAIIHKTQTNFVCGLQS